MSKCETFDRKQTNWLGLWYNPSNHGFSSQTINISELKKFKGKVRIYMRKNRFFNNGENNRPNYQFVIKDSDSPTFEDIFVEDDETVDVRGKIDELREVLKAGNNNAYKMMLPSESQAIAGELMERAIEIIKELTGQDWNFTCLTWY